MAILKAGNTEVEIRFHHFQSCGCTEYSFEPRVNGVPLINPAANQPFCREGKYIAYTVWQEENLLPFFERLVMERKDARWDQFPEDDVTIEVRTWKSKQEEARKKSVSKTIWTTDEQGELRQVPYSEGVAFLDPILDEYLEMDILFSHRLFSEDATGWECCDVCLRFTLCFDTLLQFVSDFQDEYKVFRKEKMMRHDS